MLLWLRFDQAIELALEEERARYSLLEVAREREWEGKTDLLQQQLMEMERDRQRETDLLRQQLMEMERERQGGREMVGRKETEGDTDRDIERERERGITEKEMNGGDGGETKRVGQGWDPADRVQEDVAAELVRQALRRYLRQAWDAMRAEAAEASADAAETSSESAAARAGVAAAEQERQREAEKSEWLLEERSKWLQEEERRRKHIQEEARQRTQEETARGAEDWEEERVKYRQRCGRWAEENKERERLRVAQELWLQMHLERKETGGAASLEEVLQMVLDELLMVDDDIVDVLDHLGLLSNELTWNAREVREEMSIVVRSWKEVMTVYIQETVLRKLLFT